VARIKIKGNPDLRLEGTVRVSGAKNAVLPAIAAGILTPDEIRLKNVPRVKDVDTMLTLIEGLGGTCRTQGDSVSLKMSGISSFEASYELVRAMRASVLVLGPLLARFGRAEVAFPGGCAIGSRPIDLHISGLQKMGAEFNLEHGYIRARSGRLKGAEIEFEKKTVGGTENLMMAAVLAEGQTILRNCAVEPEVTDLAVILGKMGADIEWAGDDTLRIKGRKKLHGTEHEIIPDRIETGTFLAAGALTAGNITLDGVCPAHVATVIDKLLLSGAHIETIAGGSLQVTGSRLIKPQDITTSPYPGFPTDMQAQFMALLTQAEGTSIITETVFDRRFGHVNELLRLGASIEILGDKAVVKGKTQLSGAEIIATDLRASASLVLAGLIARGETTINDIDHLDRGYEDLEGKLRSLGAEIIRLND